MTGQKQNEQCYWKNTKPSKELCDLCNGYELRGCYVTKKQMQEFEEKQKAKLEMLKNSKEEAYSAENISFLRYGICDFCTEKTTFEYIGMFQGTKKNIPQYNCLKCDATFGVQAISEMEAKLKKAKLNKS
jgi:hypothetical protein